MRYFLQPFGLPIEIEVTKEKYIEIEEMCGFYSKTPGEPATWDFGFTNKDGCQVKGRQCLDDEKEKK